MTQSIRVTCVQTQDDGSSFKGIGECDSGDMTLSPWKNAIIAAAVASGYSRDLFLEWVMDWGIEAEAEIARKTPDWASDLEATE